ncbi:hypothetical protein IQ266_27540 [filamentous cyanobacterium LEGE 11480]|uniref:Peptidase C39-like domain-containing protein n=1 Tax=Romeriopsis navalis LEGE 11480 TaxID=2777977 RepID=A0A928VTK2_9CYAN|nr:hypothetical protein [Romeriopsis navalis]MBE9033488.1 hypothetical protein [Romeriopsis navalis LEGE 11480]
MTTAQRFVTTVKSYVGVVTQPDEVSCQSACIYAVTGGNQTITQIRQELLRDGVAGDPNNMATIMREMLAPKKYELHLKASLKQMREWAQMGCSMITHGYFTGVGHVIVIDGWSSDKGFDVMDPYEEFFTGPWDYPYRWGKRQAYNGYYSELLIYAACVASQSRQDAARIYDRRSIDENQENAWCHVIFP